ncbi:MAG: hypothetical protein PHG20_12985 [Geobacteraceae bacterium]|nr:hypothetical protein [Geobacteraceae bacterium]
MQYFLPDAAALVERKSMELHLLPSGRGETILLAEDALEESRQNLDMLQLLLLDVIMPKKPACRYMMKQRLSDRTLGLFS